MKTGDLVLVGIGAIAIYFILKKTGVLEDIGGGGGGGGGSILEGLQQPMQQPAPGGPGAPYSPGPLSAALQFPGTSIGLEIGRGVTSAIQRKGTGIHTNKMFAPSNPMVAGLSQAVTQGYNIAVRRTGGTVKIGRASCRERVCHCV